jgi:cytidylate kinase
MMAIITIYQGASGSGEELAEAVAETLGYGCASREVLIQASLRYGIPEARLNELAEKELHWWNRFLQNLEPYRLALQAAFCELAENDGIVYHGHLGHELLPDVKHVIKVLLTAPIEMRVRQVQMREKLTAAAARRHIEAMDKARSRRLMALFGVDWRDPNRYDLVVNLGRMSMTAAKRLILETVHLPDYQMTPSSKQAFLDFALAARVRAALVLWPDLSRALLDVKASDGEISVYGIIPSWFFEDNVVTRIKQVAGVKSVKADLEHAPVNMSFGT